MLEAEAAFTRINWGPVRNPDEDLGTDLLVFARDHRQFDRGLVVGAQVKGGRDCFAHPGRVGGKAGWWYDESSVDHFESWVRHALPHLLVLVDIESSTAFWQHITADRVQSTGAGAKIFVPKEQVIDDAHLDDLLAVAEGSGTVRSGRRSSVAPAHELRTSLTAPFLVRPPRRAAVAADASAIEFIGFLLSGHQALGLDQWHGPRRATWMTQIAENLRAWVASDDDPGFLETAGAARRRDHRAAALVLQSAHLRDQERHDEAVVLLTPEIDADRNSPADHAWLLLQRARSHFELGQDQAARDDALGAMRAVGPVGPDDVVEIAITRAAAWLVFQVAGEVTDAQMRLASSDDEILAWRQEHVADAAVRTVDDAWAVWVDSQRVEIVPSTRVQQALYFAELNADLVGDHVAWTQAMRLRSRALLLSGRHEPAAIVTLVDMLRRSGDRKGVGEIVARLQRLGPIEPLATVINRVAPVEWSRSSADATVELLRGAGQHFLDPAQVRSVATDICRSLAEPGVIRPLDRVPTDSRWRLLGSLLRISDAQALHRNAADLLLTRTGDADHGAEDVAAALEPGRLDARRMEKLREMALHRADDLGSTLLGALARAQADPDALAALVERANAGDTVALDVVVNLPDATAEADLDHEAIVDRFEQATQRVIANAERGAHSWGRDDGRALVMTSVKFRVTSAWDTVQLLLANEAVDSGDKVGALRMMVDEIDKIAPEIIRRILAAGIPTNRSHLAGLSKSAVGAVTALRVAADENTRLAERHAARLLSGDTDEQTDLARLLGLGYVPALRPSLRTLVVSESSKVLQAAAFAVGRLARTDESGLVDDLIGVVAATDRIASPFWYLRGLYRSDETLSPSRRATTLALADHPSKVIKWVVSNVVDRGL